MITRLSSFAAALALGAAPALAAVPTAPEVAPIVVAPAPLSFGRDWTGFWVGAQLGYADVDTGGAASLSGDGAIGGITAGYDFDFGQFVAGAGIDYDVADIDLGGGVSVDGVLRLKARAGFDSGRNWYYATAGYARAHTDGGGVGDSGGAFAGLGYEVFVTDAVTAGAELLFHDFSDFDLDGLDAEVTTVQLSVNYRF